MPASTAHQGDRIHVLAALTDPAGGYTKFAGTMLCSLFANTNHPVTAHIMHDHTLRQIDRERLQQVAAAFSQTLCFYDMDELAGAQLRKLREQFPDISRSRFSDATMYRLLAGEILPAEIQRIIYLDADIIVQLDIAELWQQCLLGGGQSCCCTRPFDTTRWAPSRSQGLFCLKPLFQCWGPADTAGRFSRTPRIGRWPAFPAGNRLHHRPRSGYPELFLSTGLHLPARTFQYPHQLQISI